MNMHIMCRLCLDISNSAEMQNITEGCEFVMILAHCLSHHIQIMDSLPNKVCYSCYNRVKDIQLFREKILQNEEILQNRIIDPIGFTKITEVKIESDVSENDINLDSIKNRTIKPENNDNDLNLKIELDDKENDTCDEKCDIKEENKIINDQHNDVNISSDNFSTSDKEVSEGLIDVPHLTGDNMCLTCFKKFPSRLDLLDHYQNIERHNYSKSDNEMNKNYKMLKYKVVTTNGSSLYKCEECGKVSKTKKLIQTHFLIHRDRPFLCKLCGRMYRSAVEITNHGKVHGGEIFSCSFKCGYSSVHKHVIKDHERRHRKEFKYTCETCGKQFQVKTWYLQHQNIHTGVKPFVCNICGMSFHLDRYVTQHRNKVHPQVTTQKRYMCVHCSVPFTSKHGLVLHLKEHNIDTSNIECLCDECGKVLKNSKQLACHKRLHVHPKPHACSTCNKMFSRKSHLRVHERIHTDVRFPCDKCSKRFTQHSSLKRHLQRCRETVQKRVKRF